MRGRLPKIRRPRDAQPAPVDHPTAPAAEDQPTVAFGPEAWAPAAGAAGAVPPPTEQHPVPPADLDPAALQVATSPSFRDRGRLRRRLGYLRRVRELGFRDLGGLVFDLHRFGRDGDNLVRAKLDALTIVDRELRALERVLQDKPLYVDLREPGIAACPRCAALHGSDARFCPACGIKLSGPLGIGEIGGTPPPPVSPPPGMVVGGDASSPTAETSAPAAVSAVTTGATPMTADAEAPTVVARPSEGATATADAVAGEDEPAIPGEQPPPPDDADAVPGDGADRPA